MTLPDDECARFVTPGWLERVAAVPIDEISTMVVEDPSVVSALVGALRHARMELAAARAELAEVRAAQTAFTEASRG